MSSKQPFRKSIAIAIACSTVVALVTSPAYGQAAPDPSASSATSAPAPEPVAPTEQPAPQPQPTKSDQTKPVRAKPTPDTPTGVVAVAGDGSARVTWTSPTVPDQYTVTASPGKETCTQDPATATPSCTVTGLTNGTAYTFTVIAQNGSYPFRKFSDPSAPSAPVTPIGPPSAPQAVKATAGNGSAAISWSAPKSDGGSPVTGYNVSVSGGGSVCSTSATTLQCTATGLTNGTSYSFTVTATNGSGQASPASSASNAVVPVGPPSVVTGVVAEGLDGAAKVSWTPPANSGGVPIKTYSVTAAVVGDSNVDAGNGCTGAATSCQVSGLTNGTKYTFQVTATNQAGLSSTPSDPSEPVVPGQVGPSQPTNVQGVTAKGGSAINVSWNAPDTPGGSRLEKYVVTTSTPDGDPLPQSCTTTRTLLFAPATHCAVTGLTDGTPYVFRVVAWNKQAASDPSDPSPAVTPVGPPAAPTGVTAQPGDGSAVVSWTAPADGGSPITGYTVYATTGKQKCSPDPVATTCTVTGLTNGQSVAFKVEATNDSGTGPESAASSAVTPAGKPGAPTGVSVTVQGDSQATATWKAPKSDGGSAITSYTATAFEGTDSRGQCSVNSPATTCQISGLQSGTTYTISVTAANAVATSDASQPSEPFTPGQTNPSPPTSVAAIAGDADIVVSWKAPGEDDTVGSSGSSKISSYTATATPQNSDAGNAVPASCTVQTGILSKKSCTISPVQNGTEYTVTVTATNSSGTSSPSDPAGPVTPSGPPTGVQNISAQPGSESATVNWDPPASDGGTPITEYVVTAATGTIPFVTKQTCTTQDTRCTVSGLENGKTYRLSVTATNAAKLSSDTKGGTVTPFGVPSAPASVTGTPGDGQVKVTWKAPKSDGGSPITSYRVESAPEAKSCSTPADVTTCLVTGLTDGTAYTFTVTATNAAGTGPGTTSDDITPGRVVPEPPSDVTAVAGDSSAQVSWTPPGDTGKGIPVRYEVQTVNSNGDGQTCRTLTALIHKCTVTGLTNGDKYQFQARLVTTAGESDWSAASGEVTPGGPPGPATDVVATAGDASASISWTAPANTGGSAIAGYSVNTLSGNKKDKQTCEVGADVTNCTVSGLTNGKLYQFVVVTHTATKQTSESAPSQPVTPFGPITAPTGLKASASNGTVSLTWQAPKSDGGSPIARYNVSSSPESAGCEVTAPTQSCTVTGLTNHTEYTFTVTATNSSDPAATSPPSNAVKATPGKLQPDAPTDVVGVAGDERVTVSWTAPAAGGPIATTLVTASPGDKTCRALAGATKCTVTGLQDGVGYTFIAQATNIYAQKSAESKPSETVVPLGPPSKPLKVTGKAENQAIEVSWNPPASDGGSAITTYTASAINGGKAATCETTGELTCMIGGLQNGTSYRVQVVATNAAGTSKPGTASGEVVPVGRPEAPTKVVATAGPGDAVVTWQAPPPNPGARVTGYVVTASTTDADSGGTSASAGTCSTKAIGLLAPRTKCTVEDLSSNTEYVMTVIAQSSAGDSAPSLPSNPVTPGTTVPGPPQDPSASSDKSGQAVVTWKAPAMAGSSMITGYEVTSTPDSKTCTTIFAKSCTVSGLQNGTAYTFTVRAKNKSGWGVPSVSTQPVTPIGAPSAPQDVAATASTSTLAVTWTAPASDGGAAITGYVAQARNLVGIVGGSCTATETSCSITGLKNGTSYSVRVRATNGQFGPWASAPGRFTPSGPPDAPTQVVAVAAQPGQVQVSWDAPASDGGSKITSYTVSSHNQGQGPDGTCEVTRGVLTIGRTCTVTGLTDTQPYTFTVVAANALGTGPASSPSQPITPTGTVPGAPQKAVAKGTASKSVTVSWQPPSNSGGSPITKYKVYLDGNVLPETCQTGPQNLNCTITGVPNGIPFIYDVVAINASGTSAPAETSPVSASGPPPPPLAATIVAKGGNHSLTAGWLPSFFSGSPVTSYQATALPGGLSCKVTAQMFQGAVEPSCTIAGLTPGMQYRISVTATNALGTGPAAVSPLAYTVPGPPKAPTNVVAKRKGPVVTLSWAMPVNLTGTAAASYTVTPHPGVHASCPVTTKKSCVIRHVPRGVPASWHVRATSKLGMAGPYSPWSNRVVVPRRGR